MPDIYIARSGVDMEELDKKFTGTEVEVLRNSLARVEQESKLKAERIQQLEKNLAVFQKHLATIAAVLDLNPTEAELHRKLQQRLDNRDGGSESQESPTRGK
jgi:poly-D-alanine transfer protein DltD